MNKKVLAIVGLAIIIAVSGGVIALNSGNGNTKDNTSAASSAVSDNDPDTGDNSGEEIDHPDDSSSEDFPVDETTGESSSDENDDEKETEAAAPTSFGTVEPSVPFEEQIISQTMYVKFVVDNSTGAETSARVVFGADFESCYIAFSPEKTFEMCIDPTSGATRTGTYQIVGDLVSVTYDDGTGSEYDILVDEAGNITHVIVNYGDYNVYFG